MPANQHNLTTELLDRPQIGLCLCSQPLACHSTAMLEHIVHPFANKFRILVRLAKLALVAIPLLVLAAVLHSHSPWPQLLVVLAMLSVLPCFIYAYVLTILHWKSRYRGSNSDMWGVLLLLDTSGWFKLIYIIRHIRPDMRCRGRYSHDNVVI